VRDFEKREITYLTASTIVAYARAEDGLVSKRIPWLKAHHYEMKLPEARELDLSRSQLIHALILGSELNERELLKKLGPNRRIRGHFLESYEANIMGLFYNSDSIPNLRSARTRLEQLAPSSFILETVERFSREYSRARYDSLRALYGGVKVGALPTPILELDSGIVDIGLGFPIRCMVDVVEQYHDVDNVNETTVAINPKFESIEKYKGLQSSICALAWRNKTRKSGKSVTSTVTVYDEISAREVRMNIDFLSKRNTIQTLIKELLELARKDFKDVEKEERGSTKPDYANEGH